MEQKITSHLVYLFLGKLRVLFDIIKEKLEGRLDLFQVKEQTKKKIDKNNLKLRRLSLNKSSMKT
jgi:hypothetical protein